LNEQLASEEWNAATGQEEQEAEAGQSDEGQHEAYLAEAAQRVEAERQAIEYWKGLSFGEAHLQNEIQQIANHAATAFPDVQSPQDLERVRVAQPARFTAYMQLHQAAVQKQALLAAHSAQRVEIERQAQAHEEAGFNQWVNSQNAMLEAETPELRDPKTADAFRRAAHDALRAAGISQEALHHPAVRRVLWSAEAQRLIADAARWRQAQARVREVTKAPVPPVQRPGVARPAGEADHANIASLNRRIDTLSGNAAIRAAAKALSAERKARG
jgi:hypothetical protein